jgi:hypothetical protein
MKNVIFLVLFFTVATSINVVAQEDPFIPIIKAIQESDAKNLSACFNVTIELSLPDNENTYSASQGEMIMKDFFKKYPPSSFDVVQQGTTDPISKFAICDYFSGSKRYQVYIYLRSEKEKFLIHKIKFEEKK